MVLVRKQIWSLFRRETLSQIFLKRWSGTKTVTRGTEMTGRISSQREVGVDPNPPSNCGCSPVLQPDETTSNQDLSGIPYKLVFPL